MRLGRSVLAGLAAGVVAGFLVALLRPRGTHPAAPLSSGFLPEDASLTEPAPRDDVPHLPVPSPVTDPAEASRKPAGSVPGASWRSASADGDLARTQD